MTSLLVLGGAVLLWVLLSDRLRRWSITAPIVLTAAGLLSALSPLDTGAHIDRDPMRALIEVTLAIVLFSDASTIALGWFRTEWRYPARLLGIGLPLTIVLGVLAALVVFAGVDPWVAAVIAAALAPTDAALGLAIVENERIPLQFRQVINVESGLNDGLATPVVSFCIAMAVASVDGLAHRPVLAAVEEILLGVAIGLALGFVAGLLTQRAVAAGLAERVLVPLIPLVVAVGTYVLVVEVGGNGFVAAFVAGAAFGSANDRARLEARGAVGPDTEELMGWTHGVQQLLGYAVWFVFGATVLARMALDDLPRVLLYAVLSLTVLRMLPVALSAAGLGLPRDTVWLAGWLGPRGLASIIFGILAAESIGGADGEFVLEVVGVTVALSVLAHGLSAGPLAAWYAARHPAGPAAEVSP